MFGRYEIDCGYPLATDLTNLCFGKELLREDETIEDLFADAILKRNLKPLQIFYDELMKADYYLPQELLPSGSRPGNCYARFFERFSGCQFLTFNYDSLPEIFLLRRGDWYPHDGYGVPVQVELGIGADPAILSKQTSRFVLHLHGSLCVYAREWELNVRPGSPTQWLEKRQEPVYVFDPDSIGKLFPPYERVQPTPGGYARVEERVIAPVLDKTENLKEVFVRAVQARAAEILRMSGQVVAIGYRFNPLDRVSYKALLYALSEAERPHITLVSPHARESLDRLSSLHSTITWGAFGGGFKDWAKAGFPFGPDADD